MVSGSCTILIPSMKLSVDCSLCRHSSVKGLRMLVNSGYITLTIQSLLYTKTKSMNSTNTSTNKILSSSFLRR